MNLSPPPRGFGGLLSWIRELYDWCRSIEPIRSPENVLRRHTYGSTRTPFEPAPGGKKGTDFIFPEQWTDTAYEKDSTCIRKTTTEDDDGTVAGTYWTDQEISAGDLPPGVFDTGTGASFGVTIAGGAVTAINIIDGGSGYRISHTYQLTIVGDGAGATAHVSTSGTGVFNGSVTVDTGGSGYTSATVDAPNETQKWKDFARFATKKFTLRNGNKRIILDCGRDGSDLPKITIEEDTSDGTTGKIRLDTALIPVGAGDKDLKPTEWDVGACGGSLKAVFISTDAY